jgi:predicted nucleic acid-binding protein
LGTLIFIDSNVLIDIFTSDPKWVDWSQNALLEAGEADGLAINQIIVAEVAPQVGTLKAFATWLLPFEVQHLSISDEAAYCGGIAFLKHRRKRRTGQDQSKSILADFLIGGHAETLNASILTRDPRFYRAYFPEVPLITPTKDEE